MGSRGQPAAQDTRCRETFPAVSHGKGGSPPWAPSWPSDLWTSCSQAARGTQLQSEGPRGSRGRPGLLTGPLATLAPAFACSLPPSEPPQETGVLRNCWLQPGSPSRCAQLGLVRSRSWWTGGRQSFTCPGRQGQSQGSSSGSQRGQGGVSRGTGLALPQPPPGRLCRQR